MRMGRGQDGREEEVEVASDADVDVDDDVDVDAGGAELELVDDHDEPADVSVLGVLALDPLADEDEDE